jgi:hypothetical protein
MLLYFINAIYVIIDSNKYKQVVDYFEGNADVSRYITNAFESDFRLCMQFIEETCRAVIK